MRIGFDFDGVIADPFPLKARYALEFFGVVLDPACAKERQVTEAGVMTREQYRAIAEHVAKTGAGLEMPPVEGALATLEALAEDGHVLSIITSRDNEETRIAEAWCADHGISIPIISVGYGNSKADAVAGFDHYVDDDHEKLLPLRGAVRRLFLFDAPHNTNVDLGDLATRARSWQELYNHIQDDHA